MNHPTPEEQRAMYMDALKIAAPLIASMPEEDQQKLLQYYYETDHEQLAIFKATGTTGFNAVAAMADMIWDHVISFNSPDEKPLDNLLFNPN